MLFRIASLAKRIPVPFKIHSRLLLEEMMIQQAAHATTNRICFAALVSCVLVADCTHGDQRHSQAVQHAVTSYNIMDCTDGI